LISPEHIILLLLIGAVAGFAGGMLGIGGAFIMTPIQLIVYSAMGLPEDLAVKTAFGTSMLVILPAAISGSWRHHRNKAVMWKAAVIMGVCSLVDTGDPSSRRRTEDSFRSRRSTYGGKDGYRP
jgi:uncharacterized membrane protein YfcA